MTSPAYRTYGAWRKPRSEGIYGATFGTTMLAIGACIVLVLVGALTSIRIALFCALLMAVAFLPLVRQTDGRSGYERLLMNWQFFRARRRGETTYSSGPFSLIPGGRYRLPGVLAETELHEGVDAQGRRFGMIHMPARNLYTVVLDAYPQGGEQVDQSTIDAAVGQWAQMLTAAGSDGDIAALVAVVETLPDTGIELYETVSRAVRRSAPQLARDSMYELATGLTSGGVRLSARISITFVAQTRERQNDPAEQAVEIGRRLGGITASAARAGVPCTPMAAEEIMTFVRRSYDPASLISLEKALYSAEGTGLQWADCGPRTQVDDRDRLHHDGAVSVTWEMRTAPSDAVTERVLQQLIQPNGQVPLKRVAIMYRPHSASDSAQIVDSDYRDALTAVSSSRGIASARAQIEVAATQQTRMERARGHGLARFAILITVTEPVGSEDVPRIDAVVGDLSKQSSLTVRRSYCWQAAAFASSLGVGVIPPEHTSIPGYLAG